MHLSEMNSCTPCKPRSLRALHSFTCTRRGTCKDAAVITALERTAAGLRGRTAGERSVSDGSKRPALLIELTGLSKGAHSLLVRVQSEARNTSVLKLNFETK